MTARCALLHADQTIRVRAYGIGIEADTVVRHDYAHGTALREIARGFLAGAGMTIPGELARVTGLSRPDAGLGNRALVKEGHAVMLSQGTYRLASLAFPGIG